MEQINQIFAQANQLRMHMAREERRKVEETHRNETRFQAWTYRMEEHLRAKSEGRIVTFPIIRH